MDFVYELVEFIQANGWFILIGGLGLYYLFNRYNLRIPEINLRPAQNTHRDRDESEHLAQMERIEAARARQQAAMDAAAMMYKEEKKKKEELLAKQREEEWNLQQQGLGSRNKDKNIDEYEALGLTRPNKNATTTARPRLRNDDYNPLTGQSYNQTDRQSFRREQPRRGG